MAYVTYTTNALVCGMFNRNTADRSYLLFTREAGMLYADARSVREERSRQRYSLQDFSFVRVSLVKGKKNWKIGSIEVQKNYYHEASNKEARGSVTSLFRLLRRFLKGEEVDAGLFDYVVTALDELVLDIKERNFVLMAIQLRTLTFLGYVDIKKIPRPMCTVEPGAISELQTPKIEQQISMLYTQAVSMSHL